jgi:hypothetical protein
MNISPGEAKVLSSLILGGLALLIHLGIVIFAIAAAWRLKLKGIWILAAAAFVGLVQAIIIFLITSQLNWISYDTAMKFRQIGIGYLSYAAMIIALIGWCVLAFSRKSASQ